LCQETASRSGQKPLVSGLVLRNPLLDLLLGDVPDRGKNSAFATQAHEQEHHQFLFLLSLKDIGSSFDFRKRTHDPRSYITQPQKSSDTKVERWICSDLPQVLAYLHPRILCFGLKERDDCTSLTIASSCSSDKKSALPFSEAKSGVPEMSHDILRFLGFRG